MNFPYLKTFITCLLLLRAFPAIAHISAEMPDPIAEVEYQMMLDFEPANLLTRYKLAMVYYRLNKNQLAETELRTVLKKDSNYFLALEGLGMLLVRQKRYDASITLLIKAALHKERESGTYFYLGKALLGTGKNHKAKTALINGLKLCREETKKKRAITIKQFEDLLATLTPEKMN